MYKRILVTGSSGVLGAAVRAVSAEYAQSEFVFFTSRDCDLRDPAATLRAFREVRPDAVLHLAAVSGGVTLTRERPATVLRDNLLMTLSVLEAARLVPVRKTVMTLSTGMYPPDAALPLKEASVHAGPAHESNYSYAYAKRLIEPAIRAYRQEFGENVIGLVPNGIFGEHDKFFSPAATFLASLIRRFCEHRDDTEPIVVWGDGSPLREMTYGKDMARAFLWCLFNYDDAQILNVGTPEERTIGEMALMIADLLGIARSRVMFDPAKPGGVFRKTTDQSRFLALSGFQFTPLREGLRLTLDWFMAQYGAAAACR
ncbi:MAG: NAD-dependent epimerase/dehydratase family protein [Acidobacteria bacterium]|nr:NAD-dependent epimerase/dehydratase family protein [Acidobacteriota bacterium]